MLLDATILVDLDREHPAALRWYRSLPDPPGVPGYARMELQMCIRDREHMNRLARLVRPMPVFWPSAEALARLSALFPELRLVYGVGMYDALIAATALDIGQPLATANNRHFKSFAPDLQLVQPYEP